MSRQAADRASDHHYDGIEEYDNPPPGWWVWIFWATIAFSALYWAYYRVGPGPSVIQVYDAEVKAAAEAQARRAPPAPAEGIDAEIAALSRDGARMAEARQTFETRCAVCHGPQGQGILLAVFGGLGWALAHRPLAEVTILRGVGSPFVLLSSGEISNQIRIRIANRDRRDHEYRMALVDGGGLRLIAPDNPLRVRAGKTATTTAFVAGQPRAISGGARDIRLRVDDGQGFGVQVPYRVLGPRDEDPDARRDRGAGQGRAKETLGD